MHPLKSACLTLFFLPLLWCEPEPIQTVKQAERLFSEKLYNDAIPLYAQLIHSSYLDEDIKNQLVLHLASCFLEEDNPQTAVQMLSFLKSNVQRNHSLYLISRCYRKLGQSDQAIKHLLNCSFIDLDPHVQNFISLELGFHYIQMKKFEDAIEVLKTIQRLAHDSLPYELAQLKLAQIGVINRQFDHAQGILNSLVLDLPSQHPLQLEKACLQGYIYLSKNFLSQAIDSFENLLPHSCHSKSNFAIIVLKGLITCYLKQALLQGGYSDAIDALLSKAETPLQYLMSLEPTESSYLLFIDYLFIKAKLTSDSHAYFQAIQLLNRKDLIFSEESIQNALLKSAEAAPSYEERKKLYDQLSTKREYSSLFHTKVAFLKGLNDYEEGMKQGEVLLLKNDLFEKAAHSFLQIFQTAGIQPKDRASALKYLALAYARQEIHEKLRQAWECIDQLIQEDLLLSTFENPQEITCLSAWIALQLSDEEILRKARLFLKNTPAISPTKKIEKWDTLIPKLEGLICIQLKEWQEANFLFKSLLQNYPDSPLKGECWFWLGYIADQQNDFSLKKEYLRNAYLQDSLSPYAPIAYFQMYSYREYMQDKNRSIKHLKTMSHLFPQHPYLITAYYLIGMFHKRDLFSEEGQILRKKDWLAAIEGFQSAETTFDELFNNHLIPCSSLSYFTQMRYRAQLERAQANMHIALCSSGGKKLIYLEYAERVFKQLINELAQPTPLAINLVQSDRYPKIWVDAEFNLAKIYEEKQCWEEAEAILDDSLNHFKSANINQGHEIARVWHKKGKLAQYQSQYEIALNYFIEAEKASKENVESDPNEKLDLWIEQSVCYKTLHQLENAMRQLSRVINEDVFSPLRIKAMFLRAEIYELQGRAELALKQLEATARQGGEWGKKAEEKLETAYGY